MQRARGQGSSSVRGGARFIGTVLAAWSRMGGINGSAFGPAAWRTQAAPAQACAPLLAQTRRCWRTYGTQCKRAQAISARVLRHSRVAQLARAREKPLARAALRVRIGVMFKSRVSRPSLFVVQCMAGERSAREAKAPPNPSVERTNNGGQGLAVCPTVFAPLFAAHLQRCASEGSAVGAESVKVGAVVVARTQVVEPLERESMQSRAAPEGAARAFTRRAAEAAQDKRMRWRVPARANVGQFVGAAAEAAASGAFGPRGAGTQRSAVRRAELPHNTSIERTPYGAAHVER
jgi:hypothetical protein